MRLRLASLALGIVAGFVVGWARLTDPNTFYRMFTFRSAFVYLLMGSAVAVAFVGARILRGRRALITGDRIDWRSARPTRSHIVGSVLFGIGWGLTEACPGPTAAQLGGGRILALAVAAGVVVGVKAQPRLLQLPERRRQLASAQTKTIPATDVL
jgi:uncharacterized membrane protein YedE/YeeE